MIAFVLATTLISVFAPHLYLPDVNRHSVASTAAGFFLVGASRVRIIKSTIAGPYAIATFKNGEIEGQRYTGQLLLKRFSFGWQVIDLSVEPAFTTADLEAHGISMHESRMLLHAIVPRRVLPPFACPRNEPTCAADVGEPEDIDEIRAQLLLLQREAIGPVVVRSGYAIVEWSGNGGGEVLFQKVNDRWHRVEDGGGAMCYEDMHRLQVPRAIAKRLLQGRFSCGAPPNKK